VDFVKDNRVIFDIAGNKYRLVVRISHRFKAVQIKSSALMRSTTRSTRAP